MQRSTDRILTTHVGSLVRPQDLRDLIRAKDRGEPYDHEAFVTRVREATREVVRQQAECGIDVVADGELGKTGFNNYTNERLSGFERRPGAPGITARGTRRDQELFPEFYAEYWGSQGGFAAPSVCAGPIEYDSTVIRRDLDNLKAALEGVNVVEAFVPAISPIRYGQNEYYASENEFLYALADAMREEYRAIVDAGFVLQIDDPRSADALDMFVPATSLPEYRKLAAQRVEPLNHALQGIPEDRVRYHICWGSWHGPHTYRPAAARHRRPDPAGQRAGLLDRGGEPAPRARVGGLGGHQAAGRQDAHPRRRRPHDERGGAPGARGGAHRELREPGRPGERHRRHRLRLRAGGDDAARPPEHRLGEVPGAVGGRKDRVAAFVALADGVGLPCLRSP